MTIDTTTLAALKRTIKPNMRVKLVRHDWTVNGIGAPGFRVGMVRPVETVTTKYLTFGFSDSGLDRLSHMRWPAAKDYRRTDCNGCNGFEIRLGGDDSDEWMGYQFIGRESDDCNGHLESCDNDGYCNYCGHQ
jgi:hypothetical protein